MKTTLYSLLALILFSCNTKTQKLTEAEDYNVFLNAENVAFTNAKTDYGFWAEKLEKTPGQYPYLAKLAGTQTQLFSTTGDINYLIEAENSLKQLNEKTDYNKSSYLRALARNYISQHRFKEALTLLEKAEVLSEDLESTQKMLFDVHMELGNDEIAKDYLEQVVNLNSFDYLIRTAKWNDHKGNLPAAIKYMEQAMVKAEASKIKNTMQWAYTNIADFYGHDGQVEKSYDYFLKALELNPNDAYAKRGIAWIVYSHEKNPEEALRILNSITTAYNAPDYYLLKAEISEYLEDEKMRVSYLARYEDAVKNKQYGEMYNAYNVELFVEKYPDSALAIAQREIENRATAQTYDLLAWSQLHKGNSSKALEIMENHVVDKTYEPVVLYHLAEVYKANNMPEKVKPLKEELLGASYELGPVMVLKIKQL